MAAKVTPQDLDHYHHEGYVILRGTFSNERVKSLVAAVNRIMDRALAGKTEIGWIDRDKRLPGRLAHLLKPDKYQPELGTWLDEDLHPQIEAMLGGPARHSLFGMLAGGGGQKYLQPWHRDIGKPGELDEVAHMNKYHGKFVQFNAPLRPGDRYLNIVPRSHNRASTPAELAASKTPADITEEELIRTMAIDKGVMPGAITVEMEPGDIAYYDANLWHRGWNQAGGTRWTMHAAFWQKNFEVMSHESGQREAFPPEHLSKMPPVTRMYIERYFDAYPKGEPRRVQEI